MNGAEKIWYINTMKLLFCHHKELNPVICSNWDGIGRHCTKWAKMNTKSKIQHVLTHAEATNTNLIVAKDRRTEGRGNKQRKEN